MKPSTSRSGLVLALCLLAPGAARATGGAGPMKPPRRVTPYEHARTAWLRIRTAWPEGGRGAVTGRRAELVLALQDQRQRGWGDLPGAAFLTERLDELEAESCDPRGPEQRASRVLLPPERADELRKRVRRVRLVVARLRSVRRVLARHEGAADEASADPGWLGSRPAVEVGGAPAASGADAESRRRELEEELARAEAAARELPDLGLFAPIPPCHWR